MSGAASGEAHGVPRTTLRTYKVRSASPAARPECLTVRLRTQSNWQACSDMSVCQLSGAAGAFALIAPPCNGQSCACGICGDLRVPSLESDRARRSPRSDGHQRARNTFSRQRCAPPTLVPACPCIVHVSPALEPSLLPQSVEPTSCDLY